VALIDYYHVHDYHYSLRYVSGMVEVANVVWVQVNEAYQQSVDVVLVMWDHDYPQEDEDEQHLWDAPQQPHVQLPIASVVVLIGYDARVSRQQDVRVASRVHNIAKIG
jgi:L-aminopeptidase/D-esterase-like protein